MTGEQDDNDIQSNAAIASDALAAEAGYAAIARGAETSLRRLRPVVWGLWHRREFVRAYWNREEAERGRRADIDWHLGTARTQAPNPDEMAARRLELEADVVVEELTVHEHHDVAADALFDDLQAETTNRVNAVVGALDECSLGGSTDPYARVDEGTEPADGHAD